MGTKTIYMRRVHLDMGQREVYSPPAGWTNAWMQVRQRHPRRRAGQCSGRRPEGRHGAGGTRLEPALERDDGERPAEREARNRDRDIQEHHHVCMRWSAVRAPRGGSRRAPSRPRRIAAKVTSSVESMNTSPPHARKKLPSASVGGRLGRIERGGAIQTKKYVRQRRTAKPTRSLPQRSCIWT
jgi:hypothetical protein